MMLELFKINVSHENYNEIIDLQLSVYHFLNTDPAAHSHSRHVIKTVTLS